MKLKYFILGFVSGLVLAIAGLILLFYLVQRGTEKALKKAFSQNIENTTDLTVFSFTKAALDSLQFTDLETGEIIDVAEDSNNYVFINYWATWCAPCIHELPEMEALINTSEQNFSEIKFAFVSSEDEEKITDFIQSGDLSLPFYGYDSDARPSFIDHSLIPTSYFIDKNKLIGYKFSGIKNWNTEFYQNLLLSLK